MFICGDLGSLTPEQRTIVLAKPYWQMRRFAALLNWHGLRLGWVRFSEEDAALWPTVPESRILVDYVTTDEEFHIQINELPESRRLYNATVGPFRYGVAPISWHRFELFENDAALVVEAQRVKPFLDRQLFRDPTRRAAWKKANPEFVLKRRIRPARIMSLL